MDLSLYLVEMLEKQGEVNVPGLGRFTNARESAHYNEDEARFIPPRSGIQYTQQFENDENFARFIAEKKQISIASARYFIERYVDDLLQEVAINDAQLGDIGWLRYDGSRISLRTKPITVTNPAYYGLPEISVHQKQQQPAASNAIPDLSFSFSPQPAPQQPANDETLQQPQQQEYYQEEEEYEYEEKKRINIWVIIAIVLIVLGGAAVGLYFYKPSLFGQTEKRKPLVPLTADSSGNNAGTAEPYDTTVTTDTAPQQQVQPGDTLLLDNNTTTTTIVDPGQNTPETGPEPVNVAADDNRIHFEIQAGAYDTESKANKALAVFKKRGISAAHVVTVKNGRQHIISLGTFYTKKEAADERRILLEQGKIKESDGTYIEDYNPIQ